MSIKIKKSSPQLVTFSYGAIGEYLLTSVFLREVWHTGAVGSIVVFATRNHEALRMLSAHYPYITLCPLISVHFFRILLQSFVVETLVFIPLTFGCVPASVKRISRILSLKRKSLRLGFTGLRDHSFTYDISLPYDIHALFLKNLFSLGEKAGFILSLPASFLFPSHPEALDRFSLIEDTYLVWAPFASNPKRSLPMKRWVQICTLISNTYPALPIVVVGSPEEKQDAETIISLVGNSRIFNAVGIPFSQTLSLIARSKLFIGVDSGLTHVAAVAGKPSVVVGNCSNPTWLPSYNEHATILANIEHCTCDGAKGGNCSVVFEGSEYYRCLFEISNEDIITAVREKLSHDTRAKGQKAFRD